jgi:hypothetical protein
LDADLQRRGRVSSWPDVVVVSVDGGSGKAYLSRLALALVHDALLDEPEPV